jgi:IPT/TIG domain
LLLQVIETALMAGVVPRAEKQTILIAAAAPPLPAIQLITLNTDAVVTGGWRLQYGTVGSYTAEISATASAAAVAAALQAVVPSVGAVAVSRVTSGQRGFAWSVTFAEFGVRPQLLASSASLASAGAYTLSAVATTTQAGTAPVGGTFTLSTALGTTPALAYDTSAADLQVALLLIAPAVTDVTVTLLAPGQGRVYTVLFSELAGDVPLLNLSTLALTGSGLAASVVAVDGTGYVLSGSFTLSLGGVPTVPVPHDATAQQLMAALNTVTAGPVLVERAALAQPKFYRWSVTFPVQSGNVPTLTANSAGISGGAAAAVVQETNGNWQLASGSFRLQYGSALSSALSVTPALPTGPAVAAAVQALAALPALPSVTVTPVTAVPGRVGVTYTVQFPAGFEAQSLSVDTSGVTAVALEVELTELVPATAASQAVVVEVSVNGGADVSTSGLLFTYHDPVVLVGSVPAAGPSSGGTDVTVTVTAAAGEYSLSAGDSAAARCKFGAVSVPAVYVSASEALCIAPPLPLSAFSASSAAVAVPFALSVNGVDYVTGSGITFTYRAELGQVTFQPPFGPVSGGTTVTVAAPDLAGLAPGTTGTHSAAAIYPSITIFQYKCYICLK